VVVGGSGVSFSFSAVVEGSSGFTSGAVADGGSGLGFCSSAVTGWSGFRWSSVETGGSGFTCGASAASVRAGVSGAACLSVTGASVFFGDAVSSAFAEETAAAFETSVPVPVSTADISVTGVTEVSYPVPGEISV